MERFKEIFINISKTGWIVISSVIVVVLLVIIGILSANKGVDLWSFNNSGDNRELVNDDRGEELLEELDRTLQSAKDSVLSVEDVLNGRYDNSVESATLYVQNTKEVKIAVVIDSAEHEINGLEERECGKFAFVTTRVPDKPGIINETLKVMFSDNVITDFMPGNIIPKYPPGLVFDRAVLEAGVAKVYLRGEFGELEGSGCATDLAVTQIKETVEQFDTVEAVEIYQNLQKI